MNWRAGFEIIEPQVGCGQHLREHDDLAGVHREVFGDVEDGFEDVDVAALNRALLQQRRRIEIAEDSFDVAESQAKCREKLGTIERVAARELGVAYAGVSL